MSIDIKEIFSAWSIKYNPSKKHAELASKRIEICNSCEFKKSVPINYCSICTCALSIKIFTDKIGTDDEPTCPTHKWIDVEHLYLGNE